MARHREAPMRRVLPSGKVVWLARYTQPDGKRAYWKPEWNGGRSTFDRKHDAARAIDEAYRHHARFPSGTLETVGGYFESWTQRHPRSKRTNDTNEHRISRVLEVEVDGQRFADWPISDLRRRHALELVDHMLRVEGRARSGAVNILRALSSLAEDAITDEVAEVNFVKGVRVRSNDPRVQKQGRKIRVFSFEQMHDFAAAARELRSRPSSPVRNYEPLVRAFCDLGVRLGETLPLERRDLVKQGDGWVILVRRTAHEGETEDGTKRDRLGGKPHASGRVIPVPPSYLAVLEAAPARIDTPLLFPTPTGRTWRERNFYRDVWAPLVKKTGMACTPHEFRHSFVSCLRAAGVDDADLADIAGHSVETMIGRYTHGLGKSFDKVRGVIG